MYVLDTYEGNKNETESLAAALTATDAESVTVDDDQRRRSRFRTETNAGTEVGIVLGRELRGGDVLSGEAGECPLVEVCLEPIEAVVVDLTGVDGDRTTAVALGHAAGNRHWDMAIRDDAVLFPAVESEERIDATIGPYLPDGATVRCESVSPAVFDGDGPGVGVHSHGHEHGSTEHDHVAGGHEHRAGAHEHERDTHDHVAGGHEHRAGTHEHERDTHEDGRDSDECHSHANPGSADDENGGESS